MEATNDTLTLTDATFARAALESDLPVLVDFYADWCGPCHALAPVVRDLAGRFEGRAVVAKLDAEANPETAGRYGVRSIPTLLFLKNGEEVDRVTGAAPGRVLAEKLENLL